MRVSSTTTLAVMMLVWPIGGPEGAGAGEPSSLEMPVPAAGGVLVAPTRVVFEGRQRTAQLTVVNRGNAPALYRVTLVRMRMTPSGSITYVSKGLPGEFFADSLVRFSPRQILLNPGVPQTIRLLLRVPEGLPDGEYRSHLHIREIPTLAREDPAAADSAGRGWQVRMRPLVGAAIPVIVRHGVTAAALRLSDLRLASARDTVGDAQLSVRINRSGTRSVYGDAVVTYAPSDGTPTVVGAMYGLAVYTPDSSRTIQIPLKELPVHRGRPGRIDVVFRETSRDDAQQAQAALEVP